MEEKKLVPKLRFPGFTEPWEQRKLGEEAIEILAGGDIEKEKVVYDSGYPIYANALTNDGLVGYYTDYYRVEAPAVTVTGRGEVGHAQARSQNFTPIVRLLAIRSKHDCYFLENAINNYKTIVESTGVPQLTVPQLSAYKLCFPLNIEEEKRISICFQNLDTLITLHQRKLEHLKLKKKSLLQKLFPKEGEVYPELRFPGFTAPWEQRKLGDYLVVSYLKNFEGKYDKEDVLSVSGDYGIVNQIDFQGRSFAGKSVLNYGIVGMGDIVYTKSPLKKNPFGIIKTNKLNSGIVSTLYAIYTPKKNCNAIFVEHYFELDSRLNEYLKPLVNKGAKNDMKVSSEKALDGNIIFPAIEEQKRISAFLEFFGRYITLHQRKLEHLQLLKKALLQQLFV